MLRYWIARHAEETGSPRANRILENWDAALARFVKVFPQEYKRVLGASTSSGGAWLRSRMGKITGFIEYRARDSAARAPVDRARQRLVRDLSAISRVERFASKARAAWIAACRSATPDAR